MDSRDTEGDETKSVPVQIPKDSNTQANEDLLRLLAEKDCEIVKLNEKLAHCQELLATASVENERLKKKIVQIGLDPDLDLETPVVDKVKLKSIISKSNVVSISVQVPDEPLKEYEDKPMPEWTETADSNPASIADILRETAEGELQNQEQESASLLIDENVSQQSTSLCNQQNESNTESEYVYDSNSGFYYHPATGYYWDPTYGLFYDYTSGQYYSYNEKTASYEVYSHWDDPSQSNSNTHKTPRSSCQSKNTKVRMKRKSTRDDRDGRLRRRIKRRNMKNADFDETQPNIPGTQNACQEQADSRVKPYEQGHIDSRCESQDGHDDGTNESDSSDSLATGESELVSDIESGELISSSEDSDVEVVEDLQDSHLSNTEEYPTPDAIADEYPPCIRFIVQESESLPAGALYMVTCVGGSVGREASHGQALLLPDTSVSKIHAQITYDYEELCYKVEDHGSQNGTMINGRRLSQSKKNSSRHTLNHDDVLQIGNSTKLLAHIHKGHETCEDCEPGQVQAKLKSNSDVKTSFQVLTKEERKLQQKQELKRIKKKFGLQNSYFENPGATINKSEYTDKAMIRRKLVGSDNNDNKTEMPASVHSPINASNKGHKLLAKMGWKEGEGLGKSNAGIAEPINVQLRLNQSAGLGSNEAASLSIDNLQQAGKVRRWNQARQRFHKLAADEESKTHTSKSQSEPSASFVGAGNDSRVQIPPPQSLPMSEDAACHSVSPQTSSSTTQGKDKLLARPGVAWVKGETQLPP